MNKILSSALFAIALTLSIAVQAEETTTPTTPVEDMAIAPVVDGPVETDAAKSN